MTNLDKKKQKIAKAMDVKHPKKQDDSLFKNSFPISSVSRLRRVADSMAGKHVKVTHNGKEKLAF